MDIIKVILASVFLLAMTGCGMIEDVPESTSVTVLNNTGLSVTLYYAEEVSGPDVDQRSISIDSGNSEVIMLQGEAFSEGQVTARYQDSLNTYDLDLADVLEADLTINTGDFQ